MLNTYWFTYNLLIDKRQNTKVTSKNINDNIELIHNILSNIL